MPKMKNFYIVRIMKLKEENASLLAENERLKKFEKGFGSVMADYFICSDICPFYVRNGEPCNVKEPCIDKLKSHFLKEDS